MLITHQIKKHMRSRSKSLFLKIFMVTLFVALFIITILGIYTYYYIFRNLDSEIEKYEKKKVSETINTTSILLGEMQTLTTNFAQNSKLAEFANLPRAALSERYPEIKNIQDLISNIRNSSNYIENIFIYYKNNDYVLELSGALKVDDYYDTGWLPYFDSLETSEILDTRKVKIRTIEQSELSSNILTFMTRVPYGVGSKDGAVILNVHEKLVSDLLKNITAGNSKALAFLVNNKGEILSSNKEEFLYKNISSVINVPSNFVEFSQGSFQLVLKGTKMVAYYETSAINDWKLVYIDSQNDIFRKSVSIRNITFLIFFIILVLTAAVSLLVSSRMYNPIRKIIENIKQMTAVGNDYISDISMINGGLNLLFENNKNLEMQLKQNEILIREQFLSQLIRGKIFNKNEIKSKAQYLSIDLEADFYKVAVIQNNSGLSYPFDIQQSEMYKVSAINMVTSVFSNLNIKVICTQDTNDNILVLIKFICVKDIKEMEAIIEQVLEDIKDNISNELDISVSIGMGRTYGDLSNVGVSCLEANEALRFSFLKGEQSVISYTEISTTEKEKLYYPVKSEQKLISLIKSCDYEKTVLYLNDMLDDIIDHNKNFEHIEVCLSNIIGLIQRCLFEMNLNAKEVFGEDVMANMPVDRFKNIQHFTDWISTNFRKIIEYQIGLDKDTSKSFVYEIKDYIEKVYMDEISLDSVANHFKYNSSYFCKIFKEKLGVSFWEYVAKIRIEKSKKLLAETGDTIEQIAEKVGYNNRFSYIRTFKKYVSITPGEYRLKFK